MEVQIKDYSPETTKPKAKSSLLPKIFVAFVAALLILNVAVFSFLIGRSTRDEQLPDTPDINMQIRTPEALGAEDELSESEELNSQTEISTSPTPESADKQLIITSLPELDGFRSSDGSGSSLSAIQIGRNKDIVARGFVSFDLQELPQGAEITEAKLETYIVKEEGNTNRLGGLFVDHVIYGDSLDSGDYSAVAVLSSFTEFERTRREEQWISADVTTAVINDLDSTRTNSQFRLHFENETKTNSEDFIFLESADNYLETQNLPRLRVNYRID